MNVVVLTSSGRTVVRPDTTRIKEGEDIYLPADVTCVSWSPVVFAKVSRPGRCVATRFAPRYWDAAGVGALLYPENYIDSGPEGFACASCLDHTTLLTAPFADRNAVQNMDFELRAGPDEAFGATLSTMWLDAALAKVSEHCFLRNGDYVCVEIEQRKMLLPGPGVRALQGCCNGEMKFETLLYI